MKATEFKVGDKVKIQTPNGITDGIVTIWFRNTNENQFAVTFIDDFTCKFKIESTQTFSKKTGLPYMNIELKKLGVKIID